MHNFTYLTEFHINIEDVAVTVICDNPPEYSTELRRPRNNPYPNQAPTHKHVYYELFNIKEGSLEMHFENHHIIVPTDSLLLVAPMVNHVCSFSSSFRQEAIDFSFENNKLESDYSLYQRLTDLFNQPYLLFLNVPEIVSLISRLLNCIESGNLALISLYFHEFFIALLNSKPAANQQSAVPLRDSNYKRLYKIQQLINRNYMNDLQLEDVAESLFLSTRQTNRIIRQYYNCTFKEYLTRTRMNVAAQLLRSTDTPVSEIYALVGYHSQQAFYTAFQNYFHCTPTQHRKEPLP